MFEVLLSILDYSQALKGDYNRVPDQNDQVQVHQKDEDQAEEPRDEHPIDDQPAVGQTVLEIGASENPSTAEASSLPATDPSSLEMINPADDQEV